MISETWMPVVGYEYHYQVSDLGRVRRLMAGRGAQAGRILKQSKNDGYLFVQLCKNDVKRKIGVHILVAEAFHGRRPRGKLPNHKNLDKSDNRADNLEWLTPRQNVLHAVRAGRVGGASRPGELNGRAKLSREQVQVIRQLKGKVGQRALAILCGVSKTAIMLIHHGKNWRQPA